MNVAFLIKQTVKNLMCVLNYSTFYLMMSFPWSERFRCSSERTDAILFFFANNKIIKYDFFRDKIHQNKAEPRRVTIYIHFVHSISSEGRIHPYPVVYKHKITIVWPGLLDIGELDHVILLPSYEQCWCSIAFTGVILLVQIEYC